MTPDKHVCGEGQGSCLPLFGDDEGLWADHTSSTSGLSLAEPLCSPQVPEYPSHLVVLVSDASHPRCLICQQKWTDGHEQRVTQALSPEEVVHFIGLLK